MAKEEREEQKLLMGMQAQERKLKKRSNIKPRGNKTKKILFEESVYAGQASNGTLSLSVKPPYHSYSVSLYGLCHVPYYKPVLGRQVALSSTAY